MRLVLALLIAIGAMPVRGIADETSFRAVSATLAKATSVPVLLPQYVPYAGGHPLYPIVLASNRSMYRVGIDLGPDCREATSCRLAHVSGTRLAKGAAPSGQVITMADGSKGRYFRARCGGAGCSDGTLSYNRNGFMYTVGVKGASDVAPLVRMAESLRRW